MWCLWWWCGVCVRYNLIRRRSAKPAVPVSHQRHRHPPTTIPGRFSSRTPHDTGVSFSLSTLFTFNRWTCLHSSPLSSFSSSCINYHRLFLRVCVRENKNIQALIFFGGGHRAPGPPKKTANGGARRQPHWAPHGHPQLNKTTKSPPPTRRGHGARHKTHGHGKVWHLTAIWRWK